MTEVRVLVQFACFESRNGILTKFINDSASFLLEKLKIHVILTKNLNILQKILKIPQKNKKNAFLCKRFEIKRF